VHGNTPKAELARLTGLTAQTIGLITARLDEDGLLIRQAPVRGRVGQPSVPLGLNPEGAYAIGVKIGRRSVDTLLVDFAGQVRQRRVLNYPFPQVEDLFPAIEDHLTQLLGGLGERRQLVVGVGVAAPFHLGGWHRMLGLSEKLSQAWNHTDLGERVQAMTDLPVSLAKDTSAACVAELFLGKGREISNFLYVFVDTFVGGGLVVDSHLHRGRHGNAGALASLPLGVAEGGMGKAGELPEQLVSRASLWELEQRFAGHGLEPLAAYDERSLQAPWLVHTEAWLEHAASALAHSVVSATAFLDLDAVVFDGAMAPGLLLSLLQHTREALNAYDTEGLVGLPKLEAGSIGPDARALGGALLPLHACFAPDREVFLKV
jgi:predicted NBD/HSP70 family sugar kinase